MTGLARFRVADDNKQEIELSVPPFRFWKTGQRVLVFDQSLTNTGWALMEVEAHEAHVRQTGMIKTARLDKAGHEDNLTRSVAIFGEVLSVLNIYNPTLVVHETPPRSSGGGVKMARPEASLMSATAIRCAAAYYNVPVLMIGAQKAKKRLTGQPNADKSLVRGAVQAAVVDVLDRKPLNEHIYDAVALGLVALEANG